MEKGPAIKILRDQLRLTDEVDRLDVDAAAFLKWQRDTEVAVERIFGNQSRHRNEFRRIQYHLPIASSHNSEIFADKRRKFQRGLAKAKAVLSSMIDELERFGLESTTMTHSSDVATDTPDHLRCVEKLCFGFHRVALQLQQRHDDRETLVVSDEYDAQDLLHAILRIHFDDIRREEWTPSYAGGSSPVDFLLKAEQIVIEVKKSRPSLTARQLGEELLIDRSRYQQHPDCRTLVCFVYDPGALIANPRGIERDLETHDGELRVKAIIAPRH